MDRSGRGLGLVGMGGEGPGIAAMNLKVRKGLR